MKAAHWAHQSKVAIKCRLNRYSFYRKESLCRKLGLWGRWSLNKCPCHPSECIAFIIMQKWKKWVNALSHPFNALGILEMATNCVLLVHSFSIRCLKMSDTSWKERCGTPASFYVWHRSLLAFFTRSWTMNQESSIIYLCADALILDGAGDERQELNVWKPQVSVM